MLDCCLWDLVACMRHEEDKIAGNTRDRGEKQGRARIRAGYFIQKGPFLPRHSTDMTTRAILCLTDDFLDTVY